jgi:hypothetical protein
MTKEILLASLLALAAGPVLAGDASPNAAPVADQVMARVKKHEKAMSQGKYHEEARDAAEAK